MPATVERQFAMNLIGDDQRIAALAQFCHRPEFRSVEHLAGGIVGMTEQECARPPERSGHKIHVDRIALTLGDEVDIDALQAPVARAERMGL